MNKSCKSVQGASTRHTSVKLLNITYFIRLAVPKTRQRGIQMSHLIKVVIFCALNKEKKNNVWKNEFANSKGT